MESKKIREPKLKRLQISNMQFMGSLLDLDKWVSIVFRKRELYGTDGPFARLKRALVAASEEKWARIPDIKDYDNPRRYAYRDYLYPNYKKNFAVAFDDIKSCISEFRAIQPGAFISDSRFLDEVNAITQINPKNPIGWIATVMILEFAGNIKEARELIQLGCEEFPNNELVWLEACRLANPVEVKAVIARALKAVPKSEKLWMWAAELELGDANKSKVLLQGLKEIPNSVNMWKAVVELADEEHARLLLQRAVQLCYEPAIRSAIAKLKKVARKIDKAGGIIELAIRSVHMQKGMKKIDYETDFVQQAAFVPIYQAIIPNTIASFKCHLRKMALSGNDQRVARLEQESKKDSKRKLHSMSNADWTSIPLDGDYSSQNKKRAKYFESVPDTVQMHDTVFDLTTVGEAERGEVALTSTAVDPEVYLAEDWNSILEVGDHLSLNKKRVKYFEPVPDTAQMHDTVFDLTTVGEAKRGEVASTSTAVDPEVYLAEDCNSILEVGDHLSLNKKRAKKLASALDAKSISGLTAVDRVVYLAALNLMDEIRSDIQRNPKDPCRWIAAARKAESAGMIHEARQLIKEALKMFPKNADVWLEKCRLANPNKAKCVIAKGLKMNPKSEKLWMQAAKLELVNVKEIMVLMKGLDNIPSSVSLKNAVEELANEEDANIWSLETKK